MNIEIPATIRKDQITPFHGMVGHVASKLVVLDGDACQAGEVMFLGHRGGLNTATRLYDGVFAFTTDVEAGAPSADLNALFETQKQAPKKVRPADGNDTDS